jgi:ABC-2 type transport system ATP-binding protein
MQEAVSHFDSTPGSPSIVVFDRATKDYGPKKIGPVDFQIQKGEVLGFLGPNGSGKTTCIRMLLGLLRPSSGSVRINGLDPISRHDEALRSVAYSPELPNIQTFLTPREILNLVAHEISLKGSSADKRDEIKRVLELAGLLEYGDTKVGKLSKGMIQRLSVAQALLGSPEVLVLDEPMIGLDPAGAAHFREVFQKFVSESGGTVFMSSHIMSEVESLCTSVAMIHHGRLLFRGPVDKVIRDALDYSVIVIEAEGLTKEVLEKIRTLPGVVDVKQVGSSFEATFEGGDSAGARSSIAALIIQSGGKLFTIKRADNLLERAYIEALRRDDETSHLTSGQIPGAN